MSYSELLASPLASEYRLRKAQRDSALLRWRASRPALHEGQAAILSNNTRFRVVACGRRFGKTYAAKYDALEAAIEGGACWWVLPSYTMAHDIWEVMRLEMAHLADKINQSEWTLHFGRGYLAVKSGHEPDRLRGSGLDKIVIDEAAFCSPYVWQVLRPSLSDKQGSALLLSTPRGRNWFWELYVKGLDPLESEWASFRMPTAANPLIAQSEIDAAKTDMAERLFKQEYEAEFLEDYGAVFRNVLACVRPVPDSTGEIVFGVDWGRHNDFTVIVALDKHTHAMIAMERFNQVSWTLQRGRLEAMYAKYKPVSILAESNSIGEPNIEELQKAGLPVQGFATTPSSKPPLIDGLALAFEQGNVGILDDPVLIAELQSYEMERLPSGTFRYSAPSGGHDDTVIALALALQACQTEGFQAWIM